MTKDSSALTYPRLLLVNYVILSKVSMFNSLHNTIFLVQHRAILRLLVCVGQSLHGHGGDQRFPSRIGRS